MTLKGNFETFYIAAILQLLGSDEKTGVLSIANEEKEVQVFFKSGVIIYATGSHVKNQLGYLLKTNGIISEEQLNECLKISKKKKQALGKILCEKKYITKAELRHYVHKQAENIIYDLFRWEKGNFEYKDVPLNLKGLKIVQLNTMELIMEATRRIDEMSVLIGQIPSDKLIFKISGKTKTNEEITLNEEEWQLLAMLDGTSTVREIINRSGHDDFQVYKILNSLILAGRIQESEVSNPKLRADEVLLKFKDIDSKMFRNELDNLGLSRSSIVRLALTRIFRNSVGPDELLSAISQEAINITTSKDQEILEKLKKNNHNSYLSDVIHLLLEKVEESH